jgi:hypothetical protein
MEGRSLYYSDAPSLLVIPLDIVDPSKGARPSAVSLAKLMPPAVAVTLSYMSLVLAVLGALAILRELLLQAVVQYLICSGLPMVLAVALCCQWLCTDGAVGGIKIGGAIVLCELPAAAEDDTSGPSPQLLELTVPLRPLAAAGLALAGGRATNPGATTNFNWLHRTSTDSASSPRQLTEC